MTRLARFIALSLLTASMAAALTAPVSATPAADYGSTVRCRYEVTARNSGGQWTEAQLRRIAVTPPQVPAAASSQAVGWRFVVTRSMNKEIGPFRVIYRSPIQKAATDSSFSTMRTHITLPGDPEGDRFVWYRVTLKMFRYNADGSVQSKDAYLMPTMHWIVNHHDFDTEDYCPGLEALEIDGG
jgi:hypothetical protein